MIRIEKRSRPVIGANPREPGNLRKNGADSRLKLGAPNIGIISITRLENHRWAARATAFQVHLAASADVDETGKLSEAGFDALLCDVRSCVETRLKVPSPCAFR